MMASQPRLQRRSVPEQTGDFPTLPPVLQRVYRARGVFSEQALDPSLAHLPPPDGLPDLNAALALLDDALKHDRRILIVGDYDADGATSTALACLALRDFGATDVRYLLPDRFRYGYGLSPAIVALAAEQSPDLIITVDNGVASHDGVAAARERGMRVLVTDHHLPGESLPAADAIVDPALPDNRFPSRCLAGVGVLFYLLLALRGHWRERGAFTQRPEPNLADYLDLVALGTVADVVPLDRLNRVLVEQGLRRIRAGQCRPGIRALLQVAGREAPYLTAADLGFAVAPRLNAAGRLADMTEGVRCLLAEDDDEALALARDLDARNRERRTIEADMQEGALAGVEALLSEQTDLPWGLVVHETDWHQGVVGILASRLKERFHRPVIAFAPGEAGELKGSGRSIPGFHMRDALDAVATRHPGLVDKFGGHAMAAGLSLSPAALSDFSAAFDALAREWLNHDDLTAVIWSDGELTPEAFELSLARAIREGGPWGQRFPEPVFDGRFRVHNQRVVGERHLKLWLSPEGSRQRLDAIWFNADLSQWPASATTRVEAAYRLDVNRYRGVESLQLIIEALWAT